MNRRVERHWRPGVIILVALSCVSCWGEKRPGRRPVDLVPSQADLIATVGYKELAGNRIVRRVFDISQVEKTLTSVGITPQDVVSVAGFAKIDYDGLMGGQHPPSEKGLGEFGLIVQAKGGFGTVVKKLSESGWLVQKYRQRSLWRAPQEDLAVALVAEDILATGTPAAVHQVIDVADGAALGAMSAGSRSDCGAILRRIGTRGEISIAISFPREMKMAAERVSRSAGIFGGMVGANVLGQLFDALGTGRGVALSFAASEEGIATRVIFVASDAGSAKLIAGLVAVAKILVPKIGQFGRMEEAAEMIGRLNVASENNLVLIDFEIPESVIAGEAR